MKTLSRALTAAEVAELEGVTAKRITIRCREGQYPGAWKAGSRAAWRIPIEAVTTYRENRIAATLAETNTASPTDKLPAKENQTPGIEPRSTQSQRMRRK
jgi:hypothetical protein